jgi:hypothetical protein
MVWFIKLVQKQDNGTPRYLGGLFAGRLTDVVKRAERFDTKEAAEAEIAKLAPHPWGPWQAVEFAA